MRDHTILVVPPELGPKRAVADELVKALHYEHKLVVPAGASLCGFRASLIVLVNWLPGDGTSETLRKAGVQWYTDSLLCRLTPDGAVIHTRAAKVYP